VGPPRQLGHGARLADPRLAREQHELARAVLGLRAAAVEERQLGRAVDEPVARDRRLERGRPGHDGRGRRHRGCHRGSRLAAQQPLVDRHRGRARGGAELVAQQNAQPVEHPQRLGRVAGRLVDLHQRPVRGLPERRCGDRGLGGLLGRAQLAAPEPRARERERLERPQPRGLALVAALGHPQAAGLGQERLEVGGERLPRGGHRVGEPPGLERHLRARRRRHRGFGVDPDVTRREAQLRAAGEHPGAERPPQLGEQRAERRIRRGRRIVGPQRVDQLAARAGPLAVPDQVGEQQPALAPRERSRRRLAAHVNLDRSAEPDLPAHSVAHYADDAIRAPRFRQGFANRPPA
jgi:hypothetical protein